jgi:hypothetical protein
VRILWTSTAQPAPGELPPTGEPTGYSHSAALLLLAAVCAVARRDADKGNSAAAAWLAELTIELPTGWRIVDNAPPTSAPRRRRAA